MIKFEAACCDHQAVESVEICFSQGHSRMSRVSFESKLCRLRLPSGRCSEPLGCAVDNFFVGFGFILKKRRVFLQQLKIGNAFKYLD